MASVQELLLAAQAKKSPFTSLLEGAVRGFGGAQNTALANISTMVDLENQRQQMAMRQKAMARAAETDAMLRKQIDNATEQSVQEGFKAAAIQGKSAHPAGKLQMVSVEPSADTGLLRPKYEIVKPGHGDKQPGSLESILTQRVLSGELKLEDALKLKAESSPSLLKPPPGFRFARGGAELEAIPGGPAEQKKQESDQKKAIASADASEKASRLLNTIDKAMSQIGMTTTGLGVLTKGIPATPAKNLDATLKTIQANIGFETLQAMRDASKTGGALGQVSERELEFLQSTIAALDQAQSQNQLRENLLEVRKRFERLKAMADSDARPIAESPVSGPKPGDIEDGYRFKGARKVGRFEVTVE